MTDAAPDRPQTARAAALQAMTAVTEEHQILADVLPKAVETLSPSDKARAGRLATETLRWAPRADRVLSPFLRLKPEEPVMNALRLAVVELFVDGAAPHGVVNAAVGHVARSKAGLVNAVLRNVLRAEVDWSALPVPGLPKWLRKPVVAAWGKEVTARLEVAHAAGAPLDLTPKDGDAEALAARLGGLATGTGSVRLSGAAQVSALPGFETGDWWVQDAAAALPARLLGVQSGERVLDVCAAPGGKTMQLAAAGAEVTALDISEARLARVTENLARTGLSAKVVAADALTYEAERFDAVLLDAPCSATGTLRRHPDLAFARTGAGLDMLVSLQAQLIDRAVALTKPGGRLVFCTCSLLPQEGEDQRAAALARHPGLTPLEVDLPELAQFRVETGAFRTRPDLWLDQGGLDGFYMAAFRVS